MGTLPAICPSCQHQLNIERLHCENCETDIDGTFELPLLARLSVSDQWLIIQFVKSSGSLKAMAKLLRLSYPTVRNRLDDVIERVELLEMDQTPPEQDIGNEPDAD